MSVDEHMPAVLFSWLAMPMEPAVKQAIERVRRLPDVARIAIMPDVHLANDVCVGTAMATRHLIYPAAVGGDIGCGMLALAFECSADVLRDAAHAGTLLRLLGENIPTQRRNRRRKIVLPQTLDPTELSHESLQQVAQKEGSLQLGTLGGGNHFVEAQADSDERLWIMIHSGSRAVGQAVKDHHLAMAAAGIGSLKALHANTESGRAYLRDQEWARRFARANREAMGEQVTDILRNAFKIDPIESMTISCDHNHVQPEDHGGEQFFVHRKGAMPAEFRALGVVPGSMGTLSFHVEGRGCSESLRSSAHGAGRVFSRHAAREKFSRGDLRSQMGNVWFDPRLSEHLREESPGSYKDIKAVMRAQSELVKITRTLRPLLVYKGC